MWVEMGLTFVNDSTTISFSSAGATFKGNFPFAFIEKFGGFRAVRKSKPCDNSKKDSGNALKADNYRDEWIDGP